jgi:hypothetical protein
MHVKKSEIHERLETFLRVKAT